MKIALIGASGVIGQAIQAEAVSRRHQLSAFARHPEKITPQTGVTVAALDINNTDALAQVAQNHEVVIMSVKYTGLHAKAIIEALRTASDVRLLAVGGAGSLVGPEGVQIVDTAGFPVEWKPEAVAARDFLELLREENPLDWSYLSPSAIIESGQRTGKFRLGKDTLLLNEHGDSRISVQDYAVALVDELENPAHRRQRFTVGY